MLNGINNTLTRSSRRTRSCYDVYLKASDLRYRQIITDAKSIHQDVRHLTVIFLPHSRHDACKHLNGTGSLTTPVLRRRKATFLRHSYKRVPYGRAEFIAV